MRIKYITIILIVLLFENCAKKEQSITPSPFKPALELAITECLDSLNYEIGENTLPSIQFFYHDPINMTGCKLYIYLLDGYASGSIDGYAKIKNTTIAIYNLKYDVFELVNKNEITFFTDTIMGFEDFCGLDPTGIKQFSYRIISTDSIVRTSDSMSFQYPEILRAPRCEGRIYWTPPEDILFHDDSIRAEENLKYYQNEVEYYRGKRPDNVLNR